MISDKETNFLYLADCLKKDKYSIFLNEFITILNECQINFDFLPNTKDIWAVDYMPIQIGLNNFIQFNYDPDYLKTKKGEISKTDVDAVCQSIDIKPVKSELVIDGGNVIRTKDKVIMCAKVFKENKEVSEKVLINKLKEYFEIDKLFFLPWGKSDFTGHADGMVRFINENRVLINHYSNPKENQEFQQSVRICLHNAGLEWTEIPYNPYVNKPYTKATGIYLNYLEMKDIIIFPTFKIPEDDLAIRVIQELFPDHIIKTIDSNIIAEKGGVLNCITWNIKK